MDEQFDAAFDAPLTRRQLVKGIAAAGAATWAAGTLSSRALAAADDHLRRYDAFAHFRAIPPSAADELQVPEGFEVDMLLRWGDEFGDGLRFGYNCDYSTWFPVDGRTDDVLVWVNHEYVIPFFTSDWDRSADATWEPRGRHRELMEREKKEVGGSIVQLRRERSGRRRWRVVEGSRYARRFYGDGPPIPYTGPVAGTRLTPSEGTALGTLANCSGARTPWGTVLSCEENHQSYGLRRQMPFQLGWIKGNGTTREEVNYYVGEPGVNVDGQRVGDEWPFNGYVVEVDPYTGRALKHTALGRIHHENVALRIAPDGRVVAYTGDDAPAADGMFFRFVSRGRYRRGMPRAEAMRLLADGQLYVAQWLPEANDPRVDTGSGRWIALDMTPEACAFTTSWVEQHIVPRHGGNLRQFRVPRAEDCELLPGTQQRVLIALTTARGRPADPEAYGVIRLLREDTADPDGTSFRWVDLLEGGQESGFANPDNLGFSSARELWIVTDISGSRLNVPGRGFDWHANNAMFYVPLRGPNAKTAFRFANAPVEAELTGPSFNVKERTLFLNVQHPGEETPNKGGRVGEPQTYTSWWPDGNRTAGTGTPGKPKPSLVAIRKV